MRNHVTMTKVLPLLLSARVAVRGAKFSAMCELIAEIHPPGEVIPNMLFPTCRAPAV